MRRWGSEFAVQWQYNFFCSQPTTSSPVFKRFILKRRMFSRLWCRTPGFKALVHSYTNLVTSLEPLDGLGEVTVSKKADFANLESLVNFVHMKPMNYASQRLKSLRLFFPKVFLLFETRYLLVLNAFPSLVFVVQMEHEFF